MTDSMVEKVARAIAGTYNRNRVSGTPNAPDPCPVDYEAARAAILAALPLIGEEMAGGGRVPIARDMGFPISTMTTLARIFRTPSAPA